MKKKNYLFSIIIIVGGYFLYNYLHPSTSLKNDTYYEHEFSRPIYLKTKKTSFDLKKINDAEIILSKNSLPNRMGQYENIRIVLIENKYPYIRVKDKLKKTQQGDEIVDRKIMLADHMLIKLNPNADEKDLSKLNKKYGFRIAKKNADGTYLIYFNSHGTDSLPKAMTEYKRERSIILSAQPHYLPN